MKNHVNEGWGCGCLPVMDLFSGPSSCYIKYAFKQMITAKKSCLRRLVHFRVTRHPTDTWVDQQLCEATPRGEAPRFFIRDDDRKFGSGFASVAKASGIELLPTSYRAPRANAIGERFIGSVRRECLDHQLILSERQLYRVIKEYVRFLNQSRPHQDIAQQIPERWGITGEEKREGKIISFTVLNSLHHDYRRVA